MAGRRGRPTKIGWTDEDRHVIAGLRIALRMAQLPDTLANMLSPGDVRRLAPLEKAAYLRLWAKHQQQSVGDASADGR